MRNKRRIGLLFFQNVKNDSFVCDICVAKSAAYHIIMLTFAYRRISYFSFTICRRAYLTPLSLFVGVLLLLSFFVKPLSIFEIIKYIPNQTAKKTYEAFDNLLKQISVQYPVNN